VAQYGFDMPTESAIANVDLFGSTPFSIAAAKSALSLQVKYVAISCTTLGANKKER